MENKMKLHEDPGSFLSLIRGTLKYMSIPETFIEKDYWVVFLLKNLSLSDYSDKVVFKGGTSLTKAYKCLERFSEDVYLAIREPEIGDSKRKSLMKSIEKTLTAGLKTIEDHPGTEKKGRNRKTFYEYPLLETDNIYIPIKRVIQLEINTFTHPSPVEYMEIESFIYRFMKDNSFDENIEKYELQPFSVLTLSIERTFCEKILSLARLSYEGPDKLKGKIRHFYDIAQIMKTIDSPESIGDTLRLAINDDRNNSTFSGEWLNRPISEAPIFRNFDKIWKSLEYTYEQELSSLLWNSEKPNSSELKKSFVTLQNLLLNIE